jgi:hypothetical protein
MLQSTLGSYFDTILQVTPYLLEHKLRVECLADGHETCNGCRSFRHQAQHSLALTLLPVQSYLTC